MKKYILNKNLDQHSSLSEPQAHNTVVCLVCFLFFFWGVGGLTTLKEDSTKDEDEKNQPDPIRSTE